MLVAGVTSAMGMFVCKVSGVSMKEGRSPQRSLTEELRLASWLARDATDVML